MILKHRTADVLNYKFVTLWIFGLRMEDGSLITPKTQHIPCILLKADQGTSAEIWGVDDVFPRDGINSGQKTQR